MSVASFFRSCAICRSFIPPVRHLCPYCWRAAEAALLPSQDVFRLEPPHCHLRIFDWDEESAAFAGPLLTGLKRLKAPYAFRRLALEAFARFAHTSFWPQQKPLVFVPAPPSDPSPARPDHALEWAKALSSRFGGEARALLKRSILSVQKKKSRYERSQIQIELRPGAAAFLRENKSAAFIFADDVLTTGWTAKKAFQALNKPSNFLICTLAYRRPSVDRAEEAMASRLSLFLRRLRQQSRRQGRAARSAALFLERIRRLAFYRRGRLLPRGLRKALKRDL